MTKDIINKTDLKRNQSEIASFEINKIYPEHCLETMAKMPDDFLDCVICSPPYYGLRKYEAPDSVWGGDKDCEHMFGESITVQKRGTVDPATSTLSGGKTTQIQQGVSQNQGAFCACGAWRGQLGLEPTFQLYISHLIDIFREVKRVLKPGGTLWVNLGDSYSGSWGNYGGQNRGNGTQREINSGSQIHQKSYDGLEKMRPATANNSFVRPKSLMNIPARFAIAMTDELQFIERNEIIWHKPACMPSSAKDRFTVDFEKIFFFTKSEKYYFEQQFDEYTQPLDRWGGIELQANGFSAWDNGTGQNQYRDRNMRPNPRGRNMRTTWSVNYEPSSENHFASYPTKLIETPIKAGCPDEICNQCGKARELITEREVELRSGSGKSGNAPKGKNANQPQANSGDYDIRMGPVVNTKIIGKTDCGCNAGFRPGIVYDPFAGTGTTLEVAHKLGRNWIGSEISEEYCKIANERLSVWLNQGQLF